MNKNLIIGVGVLAALLGGYWYFKNAKTTKDTQADAQAKADALEKKRQTELARTNDPERKKLLDDIYLALVDTYKKMQEYMKAHQSDFGGQFNLGMGNMNDVYRAANQDYNCITDELNQMSADQLKFALKLINIKGQDSAISDPFLFRQVQDFAKQFPKLASDHPCTDVSKPKVITEVAAAERAVKLQSNFI